MINAIDSYYMFVKGQMAIAAPEQLMGGMLDARDWPQTQPISGALYLLFVNAVPLAGGTQDQMQYEFQLQWNWLILGTDTPANMQGQNRGDRYRQSLGIVKALRDSNYPSYTQKLNYFVNSAGKPVGSAVVSVIPPNQYESVYWSSLRFMPRQDNEKSGIAYGAAAVSVFAYDDISVSVAQ